MVLKPRQRPAFVTPMAAQPTRALPEGPQWLYELKLDGYRALIIKDRDRIEIRSRNEKNLTAMYPAVARDARRLNAETAVVDGEIVALDAHGRPSFQALQHRSEHPRHDIVFFAFDLLHLNGDSLTSRPLDERIAHLPAIVEGSGLLLSQPLPGTGAQVAEAVRRLGLEGVVAKRRDSKYVPGTRTDHWRKFRTDRQQEFVIGGYRPGDYGVDALLVGYYAEGTLRFAAKIRAGFTPRLRRDVCDRLQPLLRRACPFSDLPSSGTAHWGGGVTAEQMREIQWVKPQLLAQVRFVEWTAEGHLRHAAFLGLRDDKAPLDVVRET
jgi:DNA ligase D-like protein (predicted ligase)